VLSDILDLSDLALLVSALIGTALAGPGSITLGSIEPGIETGVDSTSIIL
jgi:hypothetical protein